MTKEELDAILEPLWSDRPVWRDASIGPGWHQLVADLISELKAQGCEGGYKVVQVKEKFGGLRFYVSVDESFLGDRGTTVLRETIRKYETLADRTCEECGKPGTISGPGWIRCLCDYDRGRIEEIMEARRGSWEERHNG